MPCPGTWGDREGPSSVSTSVSAGSISSLGARREREPGSRQEVIVNISAPHYLIESVQKCECEINSFEMNSLWEKNIL